MTTSRWTEYGSFYGCPNYENELRTAFFENTQTQSTMFPLNAWQIVDLGAGNNPIPQWARAVMLKGLLIITGGNLDETANLTVAVRKPGSGLDAANYQIQCDEFLLHDAAREPVQIVCPVLAGKIELQVRMTPYVPGSWPAHASECVNLWVAGFWGQPGLVP